MATLTLPDADVRGYYHRLGIQLPDISRTEASVRCFADPAAHRREDHDPSCSVNTISGAWHCHGCGARGGAYDAALAKGYTPRSAIDLMIVHGLIERRAQLRTASELVPRPRARPAAALVSTRARRQVAVAARSELRLSREDVARWQGALTRRPHLLARLEEERGWCYRTMRELELGIDRGRITIPIRSGGGRLRGLLRYQPDHSRRPKMLAAPGSRLGLVPHPVVEPSQRILLVEGPPDMIAARSRGLASIAVPGDHAWQPTWAQLLIGRRVAIAMDSDAEGRAAAERIAGDLAAHVDVQLIDLAPHRIDGYDLTDWLLDHREPVDIDAICDRCRAAERSSDP